MPRSATKKDVPSTICQLKGAVEAFIKEAEEDGCGTTTNPYHPGHWAD
jgi:hypothetical protein